MDKIGARCTNCGAQEASPIIYGYPTPEMVELAIKEIIALGGKNEQEFTHYCYSCNEAITVLLP
jgi:hypothetical protein